MLVHVVRTTISGNQALPVQQVFSYALSRNSWHGFCTQVEAAIHDGAGKTKFETQDFRLKPQKTLFGYDATEKVEGWTCRIFEANGRMTAMEHLKVVKDKAKQEPWKSAIIFKHIKSHVMCFMEAISRCMYQLASMCT